MNIENRHIFLIFTFIQFFNNTFLMTLMDILIVYFLNYTGKGVQVPFLFYVLLKIHYVEHPFLFLKFVA